MKAHVPTGIELWASMEREGRSPKAKNRTKAF
jgi:hypothetical protein